MPRFTLLLLLLVAPVAAYAQSGSPAASSTDGLFLHARLGGLGIAFEDADDDMGGSLGLRIGYGFSDRFTLYAGMDVAELSSNSGFEGLGDDEAYGFVYLELGSRFHFRPGHALVPYADLALSVIGVGYEGSGLYEGDDVVYGGLGASLGGGALYFLSPRFALEAGLALTPGSLIEQDIEGRTEDVDLKLVGARLHLGATFYPFR